MTYPEVWDRVVRKLASDTRAGLVRWESAPRPTEAIGTPVGNAYRAVVEGKVVRLYEYEYEEYSLDGDELGPARDVRIEFCDDNAVAVWPFPLTNARHELWNAVCYQVVQADDFLARYLKQAS